MLVIINIEMFKKVSMEHTSFLKNNSTSYAHRALEEK